MYRFNKGYFVVSILLFMVEVLIAIYVHDKIIRPFVGDFLVVILLYTLVRSFLEFSIRLTDLAVLLFSFVIETLQYFHIVQLLGMQNSKLANIIIGNYFSWIDILVYSLGIITTLIIEHIIRRKDKTNDLSSKKYDESSYCFI